MIGRRYGVNYIGILGRIPADIEDIRANLRSGIPGIFGNFLCRTAGCNVLAGDISFYIAGFNVIPAVIINIQDLNRSVVVNLPDNLAVGITGSTDIQIAVCLCETHGAHHALVNRCAGFGFCFPGAFFRCSVRGSILSGTPGFFRRSFFSGTPGFFRGCFCFLNCFRRPGGL